MGAGGEKSFLHTSPRDLLLGLFLGGSYSRRSSCNKSSFPSFHRMSHILVLFIFLLGGALPVAAFLNLNSRRPATIGKKGVIMHTSSSSISSYVGACDRRCSTCKVSSKSDLDLGNRHEGDVVVITVGSITEDI